MIPVNKMHKVMRNSLLSAEGEGGSLIAPFWMSQMNIFNFTTP